MINRLFVNSVLCLIIMMISLSCSHSRRTVIIGEEKISENALPDPVTVSDELEEKADYYKSDYFQLADRIYKDNIRMALLHKNGWALSSPLIELNSEERLKLSFDDLEGDVKDFSYTIIHCSYDWQESNILTSE